jgi:hypothetical protein
MLVLDDGNILFEGTPKVGLNDPDVVNLLGSYNEILDLIKINRDQ